MRICKHWSVIRWFRRLLYVRLCKPVWHDYQSSETYYSLQNDLEDEGAPWSEVRGYLNEFSMKTELEIYTFGWTSPWDTHSESSEPKKNWKAGSPCQLVLPRDVYQENEPVPTRRRALPLKMFTTRRFLDDEQSQWLPEIDVCLAICSFIRESATFTY